jgi:hypothetical protein
MEKLAPCRCAFLLVLVLVALPSVQGTFFCFCKIFCIVMFGNRFWLVSFTVVFNAFFAVGRWKYEEREMILVLLQCVVQAWRR